MKLLLTLFCYQVARGFLKVGWLWIGMAQRLTPLEPEPVSVMPYTIWTDANGVTGETDTDRAHLWHYTPDGPVQ